MNLTTDLVMGQVVKSRAGRDKGKLYLIAQIVDDSHVLVVDGKHKGLEKPKRKKVKHLMIYKHVVPHPIQPEDTIPMNNARIRKCLQQFNLKDKVTGGF